ncbi:MAG: hypothetical protein AABW59_00985 [archaeon]
MQARRPLLGVRPVGGVSRKIIRPVRGALRNLGVVGRPLFRGEINRRLNAYKIALAAERKAGRMGPVAANYWVKTGKNPSLLPKDSASRAKLDAFLTKGMFGGTWAHDKTRVQEKKLNVARRRRMGVDNQSNWDYGSSINGPRNIRGPIRLALAGPEARKRVRNMQAIRYRRLMGK